MLCVGKPASVTHYVNLQGGSLTKIIIYKNVKENKQVTKATTHINPLRIRREK